MGWAQAAELSRTVAAASVKIPPEGRSIRDPLSEIYLVCLEDESNRLLETGQRRHSCIEVRPYADPTVHVDVEVGSALGSILDDGHQPAAFAELSQQAVRPGANGSVDEHDIEWGRAFATPG